MGDGKSTEVTEARKGSLWPLPPNTHTHIHTHTHTHTLTHSLTLPVAAKPAGQGKEGKRKGEPRVQGQKDPSPPQLRGESQNSQE